MLEEALENRQAQALPNPGQAGVVRQRLVQAIAQIPAVGEMETRGVDEPALGAQALKEEDELELEEHDRVNRWPAAPSIAVLDPLANEAQVQLGIEVAVEMAGWDELLQRNGDGLIQRAEFGWPQHGLAPGEQVVSQFTVAWQHPVTAGRSIG